VSNDDDGHHGQPVDHLSTDLTYLHPDNLHINHVGVFAGDWAWTGRPPWTPSDFVGAMAVRRDQSVVWHCTCEAAEGVVAEQHRLREAERARLVEWGQSGTALELVLDEVAPNGEPAVDRQSPGEDGPYCAMGLNWNWIAVDPVDCDRIAGPLATFGAHRHFVIATHQPLHMPHERLTVTAADPKPTIDGIGFTAGLRFVGQPFSTVEHACCVDSSLTTPGAWPSQGRIGPESIGVQILPSTWAKRLGSGPPCTRLPRVGRTGRLSPL
jgi:hypothetical protein